MPTLNLQQTELASNCYQITVWCDLPGFTLQHSVEFDYLLDPQDQEAIRWYLEDYLDKPFEPNPKIAARTEERMKQIGCDLFERLFSGRKMIEWWGRVKDQLNRLRVEVSTSVTAATAIPWELLRDPETDTPLVLEAAEFVRSHRDAKRQPPIPETADRIRILLVICRPREDRDVPFRSVASQLVRGLSEDARRQVDLSVLRPPTFEQLSRTLHDANDAGKPFHVVHFDGHGLYADAETLKADLDELDALRFDAGHKGSQGFLLFENPKSKTNSDFISGARIGNLLAKVKTPVLVLNACRSAHAEVSANTEQISEQPAQFSGQIGTGSAFGSLAQEVMDAGVAGVVAMRYNLWVMTATRFVYELYRNLVRGLSLGAAVNRGRKLLHDEPGRRIAYQEIPLQDWPVPVVFEAAPIRLLPQALETEGWSLLERGPRAARQKTNGQDNLPASPDIGFIGRDETLLALDRSFDRDHVVLLHAYAGSGKTATAAEFARWYLSTGGLQNGAVLFTSFENYKPLYQVLSDFGDCFNLLLEQHGINWNALVDLEQRRALVLDIMAQIPLLWIWDNLEPVAGFPNGTESAWSSAEQAELLAFLRAASQTQARFLLTSRRDERPWLGDLPTRVKVPPMPMAERAVFAEALAQKQCKRLALADWRPLLRFTAGNPLTLLVVVRQALAEGLSKSESIAAFVQRLRAGETGFADEDSELRDRSLAVSLQYGFNHAFDQEQQQILALLVFFQGFVNVWVLQTMGRPDADWSLLVLHDWNRERLMELLDRAASIGLLEGVGGGYYRIHPALPWFFRRLFEQFYPLEEQDAETSADAATYAFCEAMSEWSNYYFRKYEDGHRKVIGILQAEEANLLHVWRLARRYEFWDAVTGSMQGLRVLYDHTGRRVEWAGLVAAILPDLIDPEGSPLPGREEHASLITEYRVQLAQDERDLAEAECLQQQTLEWDRERAASPLDCSVETLDRKERHRLRTLAASLHGLGEIRRSQDDPECVSNYEEALAIAERIGETAVAAICAFNLGNAYKDLTTLRDLAQADHWYQRNLELIPKFDHQGQAKCFNQLGEVAWEWAKEALKVDDTRKWNEQVQAALRYYHQALKLLPAVEDLSVTHNQLGLIYTDIGQIDTALQHYQEAIRLCDGSDDHYGSARTRHNVALSIFLLQANRLADALDYARAALQGFQRYGERAQSDINKAQTLIHDIQKQMASKDQD